MSGNSRFVLSRNLRILMVSMILANTGSMMTAALLPLFVTNLGATVSQVGLFFTLSSIFPLLVQIIGGWLSDTIGRLRAIAIGSVLGVVGYLAFLLAPTFWWLLLAQALFSITRALVGPSFSAFTAEESEASARGRTYGAIQALFYTVNVIGPALGGWIADHFGFRAVYGLAAVLYLMATIIRVSMARRLAVNGSPAEAGAAPSSLRQQMGVVTGMLLAGGVITWILLVDGVRDIAFMMSEQLTPVFLDQVGGLTFTQIGLFGSVMGLASMLSSPLAGVLSDRYDERATIALGTAASALGFGGLLVARGPVGFAVAAVFLGNAWGMMEPAYHSLISKAVPGKQLGTFFGLFDTSLGVLSLPAPWLGGQLWTRITPQMPFLLTALTSAVSIWPIWRKFKLHPGEVYAESKAMPTATPASASEGVEPSP